MQRCGDFYYYRGTFINRKYGGWVIDYDWNLYKTIVDAMNAIDKKHSSCHKAEPRVLRCLSKEEFIYAFS